MTSGIKYCCDECDDKFDNFSTLTIHRRTHFTLDEAEAERFICFHCARSYKHKFNLYTHIKETHRSDSNQKSPRIWRCTPCRRVFKSPHGYKSHNLIDHSNVRLHCKICKKEYRNRMGLWRHAFTHIDGVEPYNCNYCEFNTRTRETIINHMEKVHHVDFDKSLQGPKLSVAEVLDHVMEPVVRSPPKPKTKRKSKKK